MKSRKGQAAMEYLMTYGWAILVIVIVIAILAFYLPQLISTPESCLFSQPGLSCQEMKPVIVADADNRVGVTFQLNNQQGQPIIVQHVMCTTAPPGDVTSATVEGNALYDDFTGMDVQIPSGGSEVFGGGRLSGRVPCSDAEGTELVLTPNSEFRGHLAVWYSYREEVPGAPLRKASAVLTGTILPEAT